MKRVSRYGNSLNRQQAHRERVAIQIADGKRERGRGQPRQEWIDDPSKLPKSPPGRKPA